MNLFSINQLQHPLNAKKQNKVREIFTLGTRFYVLGFGDWRIYNENAALKELDVTFLMV